MVTLSWQKPMLERTGLVDRRSVGLDSLDWTGKGLIFLGVLLVDRGGIQLSGLRKIHLVVRVLRLRRVVLVELRRPLLPAEVDDRRTAGSVSLIQVRNFAGWRGSQNLEIEFK